MRWLKREDNFEFNLNEEVGHVIKYHRSDRLDEISQRSRTQTPPRLSQTYSHLHESTSINKIGKMEILLTCPVLNTSHEIDILKGPLEIDSLLGAQCWIYSLARCYQRTWDYQFRWEIFGCVWSVVRQDCKYPCVASAVGPNQLCDVRSTADIYFMQQVEALNGTLRAAKRQKKVMVFKFAGYIDDWESSF